MKYLQTLLWASVGAAGLGLLGCDINIGRSSREPVYVERQPPQGEYVIVREGPPALRVERRPAPPSGEYVWVDGYWHWDGRRYVWQSGQWSRPPHDHYVWIAPRYERHEQGYRYTPGQWREEQQDRRRDDVPRDRR
jgi:hypothetical protein